MTQQLNMSGFAKQQKDIKPIETDSRDLVTTAAPIVVPGQRYAVIIAVAPKEHGTTGQYCDTIACNILGAFDSIPEAEKFCRDNQASGFTTFSMHIVQMNGFFPFPPPVHATDTKYCQDVLTEIFDRHKNESNLAGKILDERIAMDKKAEKVMRDLSRKRQQMPQELTEADSVGVVVDKERKTPYDDHDRIGAVLGEKEALRRKMRNAKARARRRGTVLSKKKRDAIRKLTAQHARAAQDEQNADSTAGVGLKLPSVKELARMSPEEKEAARVAFEASLPDPSTSSMRCVLGKPQTEPPTSGKILKLK